jgi:hypothetical protein
MLVAEDPHRGRDIQSFGQRREDFTHALGWGFEAVERNITARAKRGVTSLAAQRHHPLAPPVPSVAREGVDLGVGDPIGRRSADWDRRSPACQSVWVRVGGFSARARVSAMRTAGPLPQGRSPADGRPGNRLEYAV